MSKKKVKPSSNNYRPHFVNEDTETVYISVDSWGSSIAAPHWVNRHYPGYKCVTTSVEGLQKIIAKETELSDD
jgi:hypothetical protein